MNSKVNEAARELKKWSIKHGIPTGKKVEQKSTG
jgi:hypothetical protein